VFLEEMLPELLEKIPLAFRRYMWFQHDRAAAHLACQVLKLSLPLKMTAGMDRVGLWLPIPGYWTSRHWTSSYGATQKNQTLSCLSPADFEDFIACYH
jgi:hypothetical protein